MGVDSSTSACKVEIRDLESGRVISTGKSSHPATTPPCSEQRPGDWWDAFEQACARAGVEKPAAVAIAAQQHGMVVCDAIGAALRPAKLWNDTESAPDAAHLVEALPGGARAWASACGSVPVAAFTITKLHWLRRCEPRIFRRIERVLLPHDWLTMQMTGRAATDRGDASGTGYWSPIEERYRPDLLSLVDDAKAWDTILPEVLQPTEPAGTWDANGAVVAPGTGDNMAAALGLNLRPGDLVLSLGTSGTAFTLSDRPSHDPSGIVAGFADATGRYLPLVCTLNATKVTDAVMRLLGTNSVDFDRLALSSPAGAGGLALIPYLDGERTPNRPGASGTLIGVRSDVTREQFARAAFEGVVCNLLSGADHLARWEPATRAGRVILIGGGSRSQAYRQIVADLLGRPIFVPDCDELVTRGAALQAASVLTGSRIEDLANAWKLDGGTTIEPDLGVDAASIRAAYERATQEAEISPDLPPDTPQKITF